MEDITLASLKEQLDRMERKVNAISENTTPCEGKKQKNAAQMKAIMAMLEKSPIAKNPIIQDMLQPLKEIVEGGQ